MDKNYNYNYKEQFSMLFTNRQTTRYYVTDTTRVHNQNTTGSEQSFKIKHCRQPGRGKFQVTFEQWS